VERWSDDPAASPPPSQVDRHTVPAVVFTLLTIILCIGPLARMNRQFLPLLYNRRHLGVMMFTLALAHGVFSIVQFHAAGTLNPLVSVLVGNARYTTISQVPFQPFGLAALIILFLMAATSHDFWLHNLTAPVWKALHMGVYLAYALIVLHVMFGVLQGETSPLLAWTLGGGVLTVFTLHGLAARQEARRENGPLGEGRIVNGCVVCPWHGYE
jgi:sulfoxide reductase heme-binding subunit YedZ